MAEGLKVLRATADWVAIDVNIKADSISAKSNERGNKKNL